MPVHWRRQLNHFVADDVAGKCSENRNVNAGELLLTPTEFSLFDLALPAREWSEVQGPEATYRNHRAREFTCWMSVTHRDGKATFRPGLKILDQGGRIWLTSDEAEPQTAGIKMRRVRWPTVLMQIPWCFMHTDRMRSVPCHTPGVMSMPSGLQ